jgi:hypothetical protein
MMVTAPPPGEIDPEPLPSALIAASHLGAGMAELLLNMTLVGLCGVAVS